MRKQVITQDLNLVGQKFGTWIVLKMGEENKTCFCRCEKCGIEKDVITYKLLKGGSKSCGKSSCSGMKENKKIKLKKGFKCHKLTVIKRVEDHKNNHSQYLCKCECGKTKVFLGTSLKTGKVKSCGCLVKLEPGKALKNIIFKEYKDNAKSRNLEFSLTQKQFEKLIVGDCVYCGSEPKSVRKKGDFQIIRNGVDRVDNTKSYFLDNCVPCCSICNRMKNNFSLEEFKIWIKRVALKIIERNQNV